MMEKMAAIGAMVTALNGASCIPAADVPMEVGIVDNGYSIDCNEVVGYWDGPRSALNLERYCPGDTDTATIEPFIYR